MKGPVTWMARNHVAANLLMMIFIVGGFVLGLTIKQEVFPEISLDMISVTVPYPGAGPAEVEDGIILKVEENISSISGIKEVKSVASEGFGRITAEVLPGEDVDLILQDIKAEIDRITTFPEEAEKPVITKLQNRREVISIVVYGDASEKSLREQAESIRDELLDLPQITQIDLRGVRPYEISIEVDEETLRQYGLTLGQIANRIRLASVDMPGGLVKSGGGEILIRTKEKKYIGTEYGNITVLQKGDGTEVKLSEIAVIKDTFRETDEYSRFDGKPAAMVAVYRVGDQKPIEISDLVKAYVEKKQAYLPDSIKLSVWNDFTEYLKSRRDLLIKNALIGLILIFLVLGLFMKIRLALWVMLGIPISFMGALLFMPYFDVSINMLSLFAFILALGIVVDDAIVVGENIYSHRSIDKTFSEAAIAGVLEVGRPVVFSVLTTVAAFMPLTAVSGTMGKFIRVIPYVVIPILLVSLIECLFILPAHLSLGSGKPVKMKIAGTVTRIRDGFANWLMSFVNGPYSRFLAFCLRNRYATLATSIMVLLITFGLVAGGVVKFGFMPDVDGDLVTASIKMPVGTPVWQTEKAQAYVSAKAHEVISQYDNDRDGKDSMLRHMYATVGNTLNLDSHGGGTAAGTHLSDVALLLTESEKRGIPSAEIVSKWRKAANQAPGAESVTFKSTLVRFGANIDIQLAHKDFAVLDAATREVKEALKGYEGVGDISDNFTSGKRELKLKLLPEARTIGITEEDLGRQVRSAFFGAEALRIQRGRNEVKVMVRFPEDQRKHIADLEQMRIRTKDGGEIPILQAASIEEGRGFSEINRTDRKRVINIISSVDNKVANAGEILNNITKTTLSRLVQDYPGLNYNLEGEEKERKDSMGTMIRGFLLALFVIYALLAVPFKSYLQPFIIMASIPFGIVGAILGHLIMFKNLSILSIFGIVALTGVVVNDSLLLIDFVNQRRKAGLSLNDAVMDAAKRRFRPIILTSLTTSLGLTPIILEKSVQAQFLIPMAISLGFGILFATGITLLLVPSLYVILEDFLGLFKKVPETKQA